MPLGIGKKQEGVVTLTHILIIIMVFIPVLLLEQ